MHRGLTGLAVVAAAALMLAGCSGGGGGTSTDGSGDGDAAGLTYMDMKTGECAASPADGVDFDGALEYVKSFEAPVTGLLTDEKLPTPIGPDTTVAFLNNDTPVGAIQGGFLEQAVNASGAKYVNISTGTDAQSINTALNSAVELKPDVLVAVSIDAQFWSDQFKTLQDNGTAIVYAGQTNAADFGMNETFGGVEASNIIAKVLGAAGLAYTCGTATEFVYYRIAEIEPTFLMGDALVDYYKEACPTCNVRIVDISINDASPADKIVSDLQAHPETQFFIASADQFQVGLQEKAQLAGIENAYGVGGASIPTNFQQVADGQQVAAYAIDYEIFMWQLLDEGFRKMQDVFVDYDVDALLHEVSQLLTVQNAEPFVNGYVAYDNADADFLALWGK